MKEIRVTVILDGYIKECRTFQIKDVCDLRDYSYAILDMQLEYGELSTIRIEEV